MSILKEQFINNSDQSLLKDTETDRTLDVVVIRPSGISFTITLRQKSKEIK